MRKFSRVKHPFRFEMVHPVTGEKQLLIAPARIRYATSPVPIVLTGDHVRRAIKLNGIGDTTRCSAAVCTFDHSKAFPHLVVGYVDWTYTRAFIASKLNKNGYPVECVAYEHADEIAHLNDSKDGQRKLLKRILRDGPITIMLKPYRKRSEQGRSGRDRKPTGKRDNQFKGAKLRQATAYASGAIPSPH